MAVNRYDTPAQYEYMPLPFEELARAGALKQKSFDEGSDELAKTQGALKINADPKHQQYRNELLKSYNDKLSSVTDKYLQTGDRSSLREALKLKTQFENDANRLQLESNYANYQKYQPDAQKSTTSGKYRKMYDPYENLQVEQGKVTPFSYQGMREAGDYIPDMQKLVNNIASDKNATEGYKKDASGKLVVNDYGQLIKTDGSTENITQSKVFNLAKTLSPTFFRTKDAQWFIDERTGKPSKSYDQMSPEERAAYEEEATVEMFRLASPQIFSKTSSGIDLQNLSDKALDRSATPIPVLDVSGTTTDIIKKDIDSKYNKAYDIKGNIVPKVTQQAPASVGPGVVVSPTGTSYTTQEDIQQAQVQKTELNNKKTSAYNNITSLINSGNAEEKKAGIKLQKQFKEYSDKDWDKYFQNIEKNSAITYSQDIEMSPDAQEYFTKGYGGSELLGRTINTADGKALVLSDYLKEQNSEKDPLEQVKDIKISRVRAIGTTGNPELAGSFYATLPNGEKILVQPSDQQKQIFRPLGEVADFALNGPDEGEGENIAAGIQGYPSVHVKPINYINHVTGRKETKLQPTVLDPISGQYTPISNETLETITKRRIDNIQDFKEYTKDNFKSFIGNVGGVKKTNEFILPTE